MEQPRRILVRTPNYLGDHILALPFYEGLRRYYSHSHITFLSPSSLTTFPDEKVRDEKRIFSSLWETSRELRRHPRHPFDLAISLPFSLSSSFLLALSRIPYRVGFAETGGEIFLTHSLRWSDRAAGRHKSELYLDLLELLTDQRNLPPSPSFPEFRSSDYIVLAPGASISLREWPYWERLIELLSGFPYRLVVVGTDSNWDRLSTLPHVENRIGKTTLPELISLCAGAHLVVANDSGVAHVAATLACVPTAVLFGPGDPHYIAPRGEHVISIRNAQLPCSPCEKATCSALYGYRACLDTLQPEIVFEKIFRLL